MIIATGCKPRTIGDIKFSNLIWSSKEAMIPKFLPKNYVLSDQELLE